MNDYVGIELWFEGNAYPFSTIKIDKLENRIQNLSRKYSYTIWF